MTKTLAVFLMAFLPIARGYTAETTSGVPSFIDEFPNLKQQLYEEPSSGFFFGLGMSPLGVLRDRFQFTANFLQVHYIGDRWNIEVVNASLGFTQAQSNTLASKSFVFRTSPKYRFGDSFSIGPVAGLEFVTFQNVASKLYNPPYITPDFEPFSSQGIIYGIEASQTWKSKGNYLWQVSEVAFQETYSNKKTTDGWQYQFGDQNLANNPDLIGPSFIFMVEVSFLF